MHPQLRIHHRVFIAAHAACANRMKDSSTDTRGGFMQFVFGLQRIAWQVFHRLELAQRRGGDDTTCQADRISGHPQIFRMAEVIGADQRCIRRVGRANVDASATLWAQVADRCGKRRECVQRFAETLK